LDGWVYLIAWHAAFPLFHTSANGAWGVWMDPWVDGGYLLSFRPSQPPPLLFAFLSSRVSRCASLVGLMMLMAVSGFAARPGHVRSVHFCLLIGSEFKSPDE
jgi:biotin transporter BioY